MTWPSESDLCLRGIVTKRALARRLGDLLVTRYLSLFGPQFRFGNARDGPFKSPVQLRKGWERWLLLAQHAGIYFGYLEWA